MEHNFMRWGVAGIRAARLVCAVLSVSFVAQLTGCGAPARRELTDAQFHERVATDNAENEATFTRAIDKLLARTLRQCTTPGSGDPTIHILAMSGGGDYGAFGAGFLVGWGSAPGGRPEFDVVTGVSTGALLSPFAFVGTDETCVEVENFYRDPKSDWIRERGVLFFLPSNPSFMSISGLNRDVRKAVDAPYVRTIAEESRKGRVLIVSATDLDLGRQKFWDLGVEAEKATDDAGVDRVQRMLLASAAIPAVFPPTRIGDAMYADGGVTANVFVRLEPENERGMLRRWLREHPDIEFPSVRYWVIVNNQLLHRAKTIQEKWPSVLGPSLETAIRSATIAEIRWLTAEANYVNAVYGTDIEVRVAAIPDSWRPPVQGSFKRETMCSLADLGRELGADPGTWRVWTAQARREHGTEEHKAPEMRR